MTLISGAEAAALDREAAADWGLSPCALVEAAGRACAEALYPVLAARRFSRLLVLAGSGNHGADALVMLRALLVRRGGLFSDVGVLLSKLPDENGETGKTPRAQAVLALRKMGVAVRAWNAADAESLRRPAALIIDGIAGTGISGPLGGTALDMLNAANAARETAGVVSIDIPSGASDDWKPGYPVVSCDCCLAVEPLKACLYTPSLRSRAGDIIPVTGIFPPALTAEYAGRSARELRGWTEAAARVPPVPAGAYKYRRGVVESRAGSAGSTGAARIAAAGAGAAGAGLVRLGVDESIYPLLAANAGGVMVYPASQNPDFARPRFKPDAILLGPGWGREAARRPVRDKALEAEASGVPLVLDADAIALAADCVFSGSTI
ncbi:MAG: NAD(P)H-hydrate epimerase, partial [Treponema sp.]|nr:NAD(P)H-hydrate epimerase [Treponema sp.]